jgi:hypothetical protein
LQLKIMTQNDLLIHLRWSDQFYDALLEGRWLPRWAYASQNGLGDPTFMYYQPLFYYINSLFRFLGCNSHYAILLTGTIPFVALAIGLVRLLAPYCPPRWTFLGTAFILCSPSLLYVPTFMNFFPFGLGIGMSTLFVMESMRRQPRIGLVAVLLCLTALAHLLSAFMALCCIGLSRLVVDGVAPAKLRNHLVLAAGVVIGLGIAAFSLYPALSQMHLINAAEWTNPKLFNWRRDMLFPTAMLLRFGIHWMALQWEMPLVALGMAVIVLISRSRTRMPGTMFSDDTAYRLAVTGAIALALGSELAYPLYTYIGAMEKVQFPYRFLPMGALLTSSALVLHLVQGGWRTMEKRLRIMTVLVMGAHLGLAVGLQWNLHGYSKPMPKLERYMGGRHGQNEYLLTVRGPHWKDYIANGKLAGECKRMAIVCTEEPVRHTHAFTTTIDTPHPVTLRLPIFAYPAWGVYVDDVAQPLVPDPDTGLVAVAVPAGHHVARLTWIGLPIEKRGTAVTFGALAFLAAILGLQWRKVRRRSSSQDFESTASSVTARGEAIHPIARIEGEPNL